MLAWERAPLLPLSSWFEPELKLPDPDDLADQELHDLLWNGKKIAGAAQRRRYIPRVQHRACSRENTFARAFLGQGGGRSEDKNNYWVE